MVLLVALPNLLLLTATPSSFASMLPADEVSVDSDTFKRFMVKIFIAE
jgi:hypothetical protein